jgi:hypothetical protein
MCSDIGNDIEYLPLDVDTIAVSYGVSKLLRTTGAQYNKLNMDLVSLKTVLATDNTTSSSSSSSSSSMRPLYMYGYLHINIDCAEISYNNISVNCMGLTVISQFRCINRLVNLPHGILELNLSEPIQCVRLRKQATVIQCPEVGNSNYISAQLSSVAAYNYSKSERQTVLCVKNGNFDYLSYTVLAIEMHCDMYSTNALLGQFDADNLPYKCEEILSWVLWGGYAKRNCDVDIIRTVTHRNWPILATIAIYGD